MKLSIVINGFGKVDWWRACLESVRSLSMTDCEIICVDDASGDAATESFLRDLAERDSRVVPLLRNVNAGVCVSRNDALDLARGEFVTFVDYDDRVNSSIYERMLSFFDAHPQCDICTCGVRNVWPDISLEKTDAFPEDFLIPNDESDLYGAIEKRISSRNLLNYVWNKMYRRVFLEKNHIRFEPHSICYEDIIFNLDCLMSGASVGGVAAVGYNWMHRSAGSTLGRYRKWEEEASALHVARRKRWMEYCHLPSEQVSKCVKRLEKARIGGIVANLYRPNSGKSWADRVDMIAKLENRGRFASWWIDLRRIIFWSMRKHFYIPAFRRWHTKRLYDNVCPLRNDH